MSDLERMLRESLQREDPPSGFEERVLAAATNRARFGRRSNAALTRWAAIAAMVALVGGGVFEFNHRRREREAGEAAKAKLELALRITSEKLQKVERALASRNETQE